MSALYLGLIFVLVLMACFIGISLLHGRNKEDERRKHVPLVTEADVVPLPTHRDRTPGA